MPPNFRFMTGAGLYRIEALSKEDAIRIVMLELNPTEDNRALILQTLYDEDDSKNYVVSDSSGTE